MGIFLTSNSAGLRVLYLADAPAKGEGFSVGCAFDHSVTSTVQAVCGRALGGESALAFCSCRTTFRATFCASSGVKVFLGRPRGFALSFFTTFFFFASFFTGFLTGFFATAFFFGLAALVVVDLGLGAVLVAVA